MSPKTIYEQLSDEDFKHLFRAKCSAIERGADAAGREGPRLHYLADDDILGDLRATLEDVLLMAKIAENRWPLLEEDE